MKKFLLTILIASAVQSCCANLIINNKSGKCVQLCGSKYQEITDGILKGTVTCSDVCVYHLIPGASCEVDPIDIKEINAIDAIHYDTITKNFIRYSNLIISTRFPREGHDERLVNLGSYGPRTLTRFKFNKTYKKLLRNNPQYPITIDITYDDKTEMLIFNMPKDEKELYQVIEKLKLDEKIKIGVPQLANTPGIINIIKGYAAENNTNPNSCVIL